MAIDVSKAERLGAYRLGAVRMGWAGAAGGGGLSVVVWVLCKCEGVRVTG